MTVRPLDRKLLRDLVALRGQAVAIAAVLASGTAIFVAASSTLESLERTRDAFYAETRFGGAFVELERAPDAIGARIAALPGVSAVQTRLGASATIHFPGPGQPAAARVLSLDGEESLNRVVLGAGRMPRERGEVLVSDDFARARGLEPGSALHATLQGRRTRFTVAGVAFSPEFVFVVPAGAIFPDPDRFGILWVPRPALAAATGMQGAFNELSLSMMPGADVQGVLEGIDRLLAPYGGRGAIARADHPSHRYLGDALRNLGTQVRLLPGLFLTVAAFLLNVAVGRFVGRQREQIGTLKALGYGGWSVGIHYLKLVLVVVVAGSAAGILLGGWLGESMTSMYAGQYRFPAAEHHLGGGVVAAALAAGVVAGIAGAVLPLRAAMSLPPSLAMRPQAPVRYRPGVLDRLRLGAILPQSLRMVVRHLERAPVRSATTAVGISFAFAIVVMAGFIRDSAARIVDVQFHRSQFEDVEVTFTRPTMGRAVLDIGALPGVWHVEPFRTAAVRLVAGERSYRTGLRGIPPAGRLRRLVSAGDAEVAVPAEGIVLTSHLAAHLGVDRGDRLRVEVLEGERRVRDVEVRELVDEYVGMSAYMGIDALNRLLGESHVVSGALLATEPGRERVIAGRLEEAPRVAGVTLRAEALAGLMKTMDRQLLAFSTYLTIFACVIALGVVYNSGRIVLAERTRDLATLRVMGFTRGEVAAVVYGEMGALTAAALPIGLLAGWLGSASVAAATRDGLIRIPLVISGGTVAVAAVVVLASTAATLVALRRELDRMDWAAVLKTKG